MKNQLGFKAVILISLSMFAWSGWIYAANPKTEDAWGGGAQGYHLWTVDKAGGHMLVGDTFSIERLTADDEDIKLRPTSQLKGRWKSENTEVKLIKMVGSGGDGRPDFLCGFVKLNDDDHIADTQNENNRKYGHGKWHGFLVKVKKSNEIRIF